MNDVKYRIIKKVNKFDCSSYIVQKFMLYEKAVWEQVKTFDEESDAIEFYEKLRSNRITEQGDEIIKQC